ncbi:MAG: signal transduction histidine kinase [Candidatus Latescibacterota bacterium]|jgi:signal transduction histidine kinase
MEHGARIFPLVCAPIAEAGYTNLYGRDITDRRLQEQLALLSSEVGIALTTGDDLEQMLYDAAEAIVNHLDTVVVQIWARGIEDDAIVQRAVVGIPDDMTNFQIDFLVKDRQRYWTNDIYEAPCLGDLQWARAQNAVSFAGFPLIVGGRLMELDLEEFAVGPMLAAVATTIRPLFEKNGNSFAWGETDELGLLHADKTKVRQILFNLLSNACKFTEGGRVGMQTLRYTEDEREWLGFAISDTGIGMTPAQIDKLFQPFTQADSSTTRRYGGTGLGLTISKRFCQMMGGDIEIVSSVGIGSTCECPVWMDRQYYLPSRPTTSCARYPS